MLAQCVAYTLFDTHLIVNLSKRFLWLKVHNIEDTWDMLLKRGIEKNIMLLPGKGFMPGLSDNSKCNYMRAAFSVAAEEDFDVAFARLAQLIKDEQKI